MIKTNNVSRLVRFRNAPALQSITSVYRQASLRDVRLHVEADRLAAMDFTLPLTVFGTVFIAELSQPVGTLVATQWSCITRAKGFHGSSYN